MDVAGGIYYNGAYVELKENEWSIRMPTKVPSVEVAIERRKVLTVTSYGYLAEERAYIDKVLNRYLGEVGMPRLMGNLGYCIHELAGNAHKANLKRIYFQEKGLDITDSSDYELGMQWFKNDVLDRPEHFSARQREKGLYVKFHFQVQDDVLKIVIRNNVQLVPAEKEKIRAKFKLAKSAYNLADAYGAAEDYSEGAGLGIVMLNIMLRNMGFRERSFRIYVKNGETISFLSLDVGDLRSIHSPYVGESEMDVEPDTDEIPEN